MVKPSTDNEKVFAGILENSLQPLLYLKQKFYLFLSDDNVDDFLGSVRTALRIYSFQLYIREVICLNNRKITYPSYLDWDYHV